MEKTKIKSGFVSIVGRPNVGKSTLLNHFIGSKISIVTSKAQTTRNNIKGILNAKDYQIVFIDTPGIHTSKKELDRFMNASALSSTKDVEVILFLLPANEYIGKNDEFIINQLQKKECRKILVITKSDIVKPNDLIIKLNEVSNLKVKFDDIIPISSINNTNVDMLLTLILKYLPETGFKFYDDDAITDQPNRFYIREIIREAILFKLGQEVPHSIAILIDELIIEDEKINIIASIIVERNSQKGIVIGNQGTKIKDIKYLSRKNLKQAFGKDINLELFVKVQENWRNSPNLIKKMGYDKDKY